MSSTRDDFSKAVVDSLCKRAAFICSNPICRASTLAPSDIEQGKYLYIGKAAHICAAASGGPRYKATMSTEERTGINNAIFLCSSCADMIDKNEGKDFPETNLRQWKVEHEKWVKENLNKRGTGRGGDGGGGTIVGNRGTVIGGRGGDGDGDGGVSGIGGKGGSGFIQGDDGLIIGGDGGNAATADGRGGRGARGPTERFGYSTDFWGFGRGGSSPNHPEYDRRISLLQRIRGEYLLKFPVDAPYVEAGIDIVPLDWVNQRLIELGEIWQVVFGKVGYVLPVLEEKIELHRTHSLP
ncbi:hypothetical protein [Azonexus sp.]|jgi:hypothetical protein|uniref:hypothetical protein n=1 Tax=Azonexus sp. TaxID=1872668 RepID=UPI00281B7923|nr:hypothetical protein [Azonexus sp.]MDR1994245.1 hypothetical protein [Azonexus sp.]